MVVLLRRKSSLATGEGLQPRQQGPQPYRIFDSNPGVLARKPPRHLSDSPALWLSHRYLARPLRASIARVHHEMRGQGRAKVGERRSPFVHTSEERVVLIHATAREGHLILAQAGDRLVSLPHFLYADFAFGAAAALDRDRPDKIRICGEVATGEEYFEPPRGWPIVAVMPDRRKRRLMTAFVLKGRQRHIFDALLIGRVPGVAAHRSNLAEEPPEEVDIVDRMLDQRAATGSFEVAPPGASVLASNGEELVVAEVGGEQRTQPGFRNQRLDHGEHR